MARSPIQFDWIGKTFVGLALVCAAMFIASLYFDRDVLRDFIGLPGLALLLMFVFHVNGLEDDHAKEEGRRLWIYFTLIIAVQSGFEFVFRLLTRHRGWETVFDGAAFVVLAFFGAIVAQDLRRKSKSRETRSEDVSV